MSYFILHVGNIASLGACMFLVFLLLSMGFPLLKVIRARFGGVGVGGEHCQSKGSWRQKKNIVNKQAATMENT
jgi:hypothetical protein